MTNLVGMIAMMIVCIVSLTKSFRENDPILSEILLNRAIIAVGIIQILE